MHSYIVMTWQVFTVTHSCVHGLSSKKCPKETVQAVLVIKLVIHHVYYILIHNYITVHACGDSPTHGDLLATSKETQKTA